MTTAEPDPNDPRVAELETLALLRTWVTRGFIALAVIVLALFALRLMRWVWLFVAVFAVLVALAMVVALGSAGGGDRRPEPPN